MILQAERRPTVSAPTDQQVRSAVMSLQPFGICSFALLTDASGNYVQAAGGGATCMLERRDIASGRHFRAHTDRPGDRPDGTQLVFGGGAVPLAADEWMGAAVVADVFSAFLRGAEMPPGVLWRDITETLNA